MDIDYETMNLNEDDLEDISDINSDTYEEMTELPDTIDTENPVLELQNYVEINDNLVKYLESLENKLQEGKLDDFTFVLENLLVKYKQALIHRRFKIDDEIDQQKIERVRQLKKELENELVTRNIEEFEFNRKYYNLLNFEYNLLLKYEDYTLKSTKIKDNVPESFEEGIKGLIQSEQSYFKRIAKQRNIDWPEKPKIKKNESQKVKLQKYLKYHLDIEKASILVKNFIPGYKLRTVQALTQNEDPTWVIEYPNTLKLERLKEEFLREKKEADLNNDPINELKLQALRNLLENKSKEELLECISDFDIVHKLSYIERLRRNKIPVMKFREYPETFEKLQQLLGEEAIYYKISTNDLTKDFNKTYYNVSPNVELDNMPKTFNPVYFVKIKNNIHNTELPPSIEETKMETKMEEIKTSSKGYSFLLKINKIPKKTKQSKTHNYVSDYVEKGSTITISLKPQYFRSDKVISNTIDERYYNIIKPLSDDLYSKLKSQQLPSNKTDLVEVYELHVPVPILNKDDKEVKLVRRYEKFEDYLGDLVLILETNMQELETRGNVREADILFIKIQKIKQYLKTGKDPEFEISSKYTNEDFVNMQPNIQIQRNNGINKLRDYIFNFYPNNEEFVEVLENDIFNFSHRDYVDNIDKILFIFREYSSTLDDYINARISFIELIGMELPLTLPEDDLPNLYTDPGKTFRYLYAWMPNIELYNKYKTQFENVNNNNIIKFKTMNPELSHIEVDEIFFQLFEYKQWEKSKLKLRTLQIPKHKNPVRMMVSFLKKERNKLASRRIFRVAKIEERVTVRQRLYRIFGKCNIQNFTDKDIKQLCETSENIIYSYSKYPNQYLDLVELVEKSYTTICNLITDPKIIIPVMTEFIIKEGDLKYINLERINNLLNILDSNDFKLIIDILKLMRNEELEAYQTALIETQNQESTRIRQKLIRAINQVLEQNKEHKKQLMYNIAENTYIAPVITNMVPKIQTGPDRFYVPEYYIVGEHEYLYGGNFPEFKNMETDAINYTNDELYSLAVMLKIDYEENIKIDDLYKVCMKTLKESSSIDTTIYPKQVILDYTPPIVKKKEYSAFVNYIYRQRLGVNSPGEVYIVYKDVHDIEYAVPFKYNESGLPIYSNKFLKSDIKKYYYIEGPAEFEETTENNFLTSSMYIFVEYTDKYQKTKLFREGVNSKFVKRTQKENFDSCNRFTNEFSCNDINSYGLNKMKCKFIKNKCVSVRLEVEQKQLLEDLQNVKFTRKVKKSGKQEIITDYVKTKTWQDAIKKANDYIAQILVIKRLNDLQIKELALEQKAKLTNYYNFLQQWNPEERQPILQSIIEEPTFDNLKDYTDYSLQSGPLIPTKEQQMTKRDTQKQEEQKEQEEQEEQKEQKEQEEQEETSTEVQESEIIVPEDITDYTTISLPKTVIKHRTLSNRQLIVGNKYMLPDNSMSILVDKPTIKEPNKKLIFENGQSFHITGVSIREYKESELIEQINFKISKENLKLIEKPPTDFQYMVIEKEYKIDKNTISIKHIKTENKKVPLDIIYLTYSEMISRDTSLQRNEITSTIIYNSMGKVLYGTYIRDDNGFLESQEVYPATIEAKVHALKYSVNLNELSKTILGEIQLIDVINFYNQVLPTIKTINHEIVSQLEYGILNKEYKLLKKYVKIAEKQMKNDPDVNILQLLEEGRAMLLEKEQQKTKNVEQDNIKQIPETVTPVIPEAPKVIISYVVKKRRKGKDNED